jgi:hypothetical protein
VVMALVPSTSRAALWRHHAPAWCSSHLLKTSKADWTAPGISHPQRFHSLL